MELTDPMVSVIVQLSKKTYSLSVAQFSIQVQNKLLLASERKAKVLLPLCGSDNICVPDQVFVGLLKEGIYYYFGVPKFHVFCLLLLIQQPA